MNNKKHGIFHRFKSWFQSLPKKQSAQVTKSPIDELGEGGLTETAKAEIDQLREAKGWGVGLHRSQKK